MKSLKILILEDDLETVESILFVMRSIEEESDLVFEVTIIPDYIQVEAFINKNPQIKFDILLLDRDCYLGGSFHIVDLNNFDLNKIVSISSVPQYNKDAEDMGVKRVVFKEYVNLEKFKYELKNQLLEIISGSSK